MTTRQTKLSEYLPGDWRTAQFLGRVAGEDGPVPVLLRGGEVHDLSAQCPTTSHFRADMLDQLAKPLGEFDAIAAARGWSYLSPIDLHCVKAAGVTFAVSAIERVIEERARGDAGAAAQVRTKIEARVGAGVRSVVPGSEQASRLKDILIDEGLWSQYLEVAIGPDAEIFTKAPVLSSVGAGAAIGVRSDSSWNNPEPEIVLVAGPDGRAIGAALGNDVNLRDFEGRSALLLGKAKDNRGSCSLGPMIRLFDDGYGMNDVRQAEVQLTIVGDDGYRLDGQSNMREISRDPEELLQQATSEHDYPDGFVLFLGTMFAPIQDRDEPGRGFTHKPGDVVTIANSQLGSLRNQVETCAAIDPWSFGIADLMHNLATRGLLLPGPA